jgi:hypothetical protein
MFINAQRNDSSLDRPTRSSIHLGEVIESDHRRH